MLRIAPLTALAAAALSLAACNAASSDRVTNPQVDTDLQSLAAGSNAGGTQGGVTGPAFYVDGELYRTVGTPTTLPQNAPADSFDVIYDLSEDQSHNVATVAPGYPGFNGGRWQVHAISFTDYAAALATYDTNSSGDFDSAAEVEAALEGGAATDLGVVKSFECPVIPVPQGRH